jgi:ribose transport system ATP-binding protein
VEVSIRAREIVGLAGADDNGQLELLRGLAAVDPPDGRLEVDGRPVVNYASAVESGVAFLSGDRRNESLFSSLAVRENLAVGVLGKLSTASVISWTRERRLVDGTVGTLGIRLASAEHPVSSLSGGNQQKVALGRVLATEPKVLLIDEPTQGVDVRSRMDIYRLLRNSANDGLAVMLLSSDASELSGLCDRILVVSRGKLVAELPGSSATEERIVNAFAGAGQDGHRDGDAAAAIDHADPDLAAGRPASLFGRLAGRYSNAARLMMLVALILVLGAYAQSQNDTFLTTQSVYNILFLAVPLAALAAAQFVVLFVGGIDISVGATMAVAVVLLSFVVDDQAFLPGLLMSLSLAIGVGLVVGVVNAALVEGVKISPVIATIATLGILQGVGLMLRPTAEGVISPDLIEGLTTKVWIFPWALLVLGALFLIGDWALRATGAGLRLRAVGLNSAFAYRLGVNAPRLRQLAYVTCAVMAAIAGVLLASQVGIGDPTVGNGYILLAIAAPVLGGASLLGGYGSFFGCLLGAVLLVLAQSLTTTLGISAADGFYLTGGLTLLALLLYTSGPAETLRTAVRTLRRKLALSSAR